LGIGLTLTTPSGMRTRMRKVAAPPSQPCGTRSTRRAVEPRLGFAVLEGDVGKRWRCQHGQDGRNRD